jgi:hypothetical protein
MLPNHKSIDALKIAVSDGAITSAASLRSLPGILSCPADLDMLIVESNLYNLVNNIHRGYYTAARRYDFYLRVVKTIFYERAQRVSKILFSPREDKLVISSNHGVMFCLLYSPK